MNSPRWRLLVASAISLGVAGCAQLSPSVPLNPPGARGEPLVAQGQAAVAAEATPSPQADSAKASAPTAIPTPVVRTATVRRGPIGEVLLLNGRVAGLNETPLSFANRGTVDSVLVQPGQSVAQGQVLVNLDPKQLEKELAAAQARAAASADRLRQAQHQANERRDSAVAEAEARLRQAQADLDKVRAGASQADRQAADAAVLTASNALDRAQLDLAKVTADPDPAAIRTAQQQVTSGQLALQAALAEQARLKAGPDPSALREAERAVADAKAGLLAAQADYTKLTQGPDPYEVRAAERAVQQAQANLNAASDTSPSDTRTPAARDAAITTAKAALQDAQDRLAKLKQPPSPDSVALAQSKLEDAKATLAFVQDRLTVIQKGPDQLALDKAQAAVDAAHDALDNAQANLSQLQAGPAPDQVRTAKAAVEAAQLALQSAQTRQAELNSHPTPAELKDAQDRVAAARSALDRARSGSAAAGSPGAADLGALQRELDDANAQVRDAQQTLDATQLRAPTDATVAQVLVQPGDTTDSSKPAVVLAQSAEPVIRVNLLDGDKPKRVEVGQTAKIQLDGSDTQFDGQVADFAQPASNGDRIALVRVAWGSAHPTVGTAARASITVQQKDNALLVPKRAIKWAGSRRYLDILDGSTRKPVTVEVGITTATEAEITSGVSEGESIVLDSSVDAIESTTTALKAAATPTAPPATPTAIAEQFADNRRGWPSDPQSTAWLADGAYHLFARQAARFVAVGIPGLEALGDVTISGSFHKTGGPAGGGYGLILRDQGTGPRDGLSQEGRFYVFEVGDKGEFGVWLRDIDHWVDLVPWTHSDAVRPGSATNELTVTASGDQLTFVVNGTQVANQTDTVLHQGTAGIFVGGDGNQVSLNHLTVSTPR